VGRAIMQGHDFSGAPMADAPTHEGIQGTGGLFSSADDILQWLSWHLDRFTDEDASMRQIDHAVYVHRDALDPIFGMDESGRMDAMALAWVVMNGSDGRPTILQKAGGRQGMFAYTAFAPAHGIGAFVAINQFDVAAAGAMAAVVNDLIADLAVR
ncbi:MAG TPA: serine hydrolase, partial [Saliniramus sp.]|nr:serine hydrolase [Saliniramus sp.]